jgi:hypothetical protein
VDAKGIKRVYCGPFYFYSNADMFKEINGLKESLGTRDANVGGKRIKLSLCKERKQGKG